MASAIRQIAKGASHSSGTVKLTRVDEVKRVAPVAAAADDRRSIADRTGRRQIVRRTRFRIELLSRTHRRRRRRSRYDAARSSSARAATYARGRCTRLPPRARMRTDNRYSVTPTLAGDKGLNGRQMHGLQSDVMHRPSPSI